MRSVWVAHDAFPLFEERAKEKLIEMNVIPIKIFENK